MKTVFHPASSRGFANHGWLQAAHSFSFANYYNPERVHFGALRVLNDDIIAAGEGFGTHPHDNMEIVTIPLEGRLEHKDSMGNGSVITTGEIQNMSAGSGITHSEFNPLPDKPGNLLQIWIIPKLKDITPRYGQLKYDSTKLVNKIVSFVSPITDENKLWINQDAWVSLSKPAEGTELIYHMNQKDNGLYLFVIRGEVEAGELKLGLRDAAGFWDADEISIKAGKDSFLLLLDVPMNVD
jgi:redox-sensitive bicupin YhaK (pirin superfamily)